MKKHLSAIITSIGIMIGIILLILIQVIGKTNILDILVRCYAFSIPLWITIIVSLKRKEKQYRYFKKRPPPVQRVVCSRAISPCYQASVSRRWLSLSAMRILFTQPSHSSVQAILLLTRRYPLRGIVTTWHYPLKGSSYSFTLNLSIAISCFSCSWIYFFIVASFNPTVLT